MPAVFRIKNSVTGPEKTAPAMDKQTTDYVLGIERNFHKEPSSKKINRTNSFQSVAIQKILQFPAVFALALEEY